MSRNSYTIKEDKLLCEYMADHNPEPKGRTSKKLYMDLVQTQPWAKGHSWQGWRERYRSQEGYFTISIAKIVEKRRLASGDKESKQPESLQPQAGPSQSQNAVYAEPEQQEQPNHSILTGPTRPAPHPLFQTNTETLLAAQRAKSQLKLKKRANSSDRDSGFFESSTEPVELRPAKQPEPGPSTHSNLNPLARPSQKPPRLQNTGLGNRFPNIGRKRAASSDSDEDVQPRTTTWPPIRPTKRRRLDESVPKTIGMTTSAEHFEPDMVGAGKSNALPMHSTPPRAAAAKEGESSKLLPSFTEASVELPSATLIPPTLIAPTAPSTPADKTASLPSKSAVEPKSALRNPSHQRQTPRVSFSASRKDADDPFTDNTPSLLKNDDVPEVPSSHVTRSVDLRQHANPAEPYIVRMHELGEQFWVKQMTEKYPTIVPEQACKVLRMTQDDEKAEDLLKTWHDSMKGIGKKVHPLSLCRGVCAPVRKGRATRAAVVGLHQRRDEDLRPRSSRSRGWTPAWWMNRRTRRRRDQRQGGF
ncbi:hypothetical protein CYLTODRAFT_245 [Cylindrobasidium torrendii FP15055 ss-10]|uniref:TERF2-interacting telomeric protein 1 Myb domain-containing protein n=1 Tax=Cylindrobasidium torrendii FP15055 ss-10 TaxID=1314674 RepID=A0A0D7BVP1_9AGAR|nr:hypothetical protein CYLTODRAFT_245 [Cylindrobasidium torrendii FP15055 ss-10]